MNTQIHQKITDSLQELDSFQLLEISDFIEFIHQKRGISVPDSETIDKLYGKYRDRLSSSQEFSKRKRVEIDLEEKRWHRR